MSRTQKELQELFNTHGRDGTQDIIDSQRIVDKRDIAQLRTLVEKFDKEAEEIRLNRTESREEETLNLVRESNKVALEASLAANEANRIANLSESHSKRQAEAAERASRYAMYAAVVSTVALILSMKTEILILIFG